MIKLTATGAVLLLLAMTGPRQTPAKAPSFLIAPGRVGALEVGMDAGGVFDEVGRSQARLVAGFQEGFFTPYIEVRVPSASVAPALHVFIAAVCSEFTVDVIDVYDPKFRTSDGLGVGTTLSELRRLRKVELQHNEGPWALAESAGMAFRVDFERGDTAKVEYVRVMEPGPDRGVVKPCR